MANDLIDQTYRFILANTEVLHDKIGQLASRVRELEDALADQYSRHSTERHPLLSEELLQIKRPLEREPKKEAGEAQEAETSENIDAVGSLWVHHFVFSRSCLCSISHPIVLARYPGTGKPTSSVQPLIHG